MVSKTWIARSVVFRVFFAGKESIPGLTWPHLVFHKRMTLWLGDREVQIIHIGRSHTAGDTIVWLPKEKVISPAIPSNTAPHPIAVMPTLAIGRARSMQYAR